MNNVLALLALPATPASVLGREELPGFPYSSSSTFTFGLCFLRLRFFLGSLLPWKGWPDPELYGNSDPPGAIDAAKFDPGLSEVVEFVPVLLEVLSDPVSAPCCGGAPRPLLGGDRTQPCLKGPCGKYPPVGQTTLCAVMGAASGPMGNRCCFVWNLWGPELFGSAGTMDCLQCLWQWSLFLTML